MAQYISVMQIQDEAKYAKSGPYTANATYAIPGHHLVYFASSKLVRVPTAGVTIAGILLGDAAADDADCMIIPVTDGLEFEMPISGTAASLVVGTRYGITGSTAGAAAANTCLDQTNTSNDALIFHRFGRTSLTTGLYITAWVSVYHAANQWNGVVEGT